jgi:hypothetical protein
MMLCESIFASDDLVQKTAKIARLEIFVDDRTHPAVNPDPLWAQRATTVLLGSGGHVGYFILFRAEKPSEYWSHA